VIQGENTQILTALQKLFQPFKHCM